MGRKTLLLVNRGKPQVRDVVGEVRSIIESHGTLVDEQSSEGEPITDARGAELIVVLGGDGTIIAQARRCASLDLPMVGVNFGRLGFLAEYDLDAFREQAPTLVGGGELEIDHRLMLDIKVFADGKLVGSETALNDCVITAGPPFRMIEIGISIDGENGPVLSGDGVIIATPTGSTAYSVSAGGPIITPEIDAMTVTPIAAHSLAFRPIVLRGESTIELHVIRANTTESTAGCTGTTLVLDGQGTHALTGGEVVRVTKSSSTLRLVQNTSGSYWRTLVQKLHWAVPPLRRPEPS